MEFKLHKDSVMRIYRALKEFGYPLTVEYVETEVQRLLDGGAPIGGPSGFMYQWLKDAGLLPRLTGGYDENHD